LRRPGYPGHPDQPEGTFAAPRQQADGWRPYPDDDLEFYKPPAGAQKDDWEAALPGGFAPAQAADDWEPAPEGGFKPPDDDLVFYKLTADGWKPYREPKPAPGAWESFLAGLERGVSGVTQTGELILNKILGRPTDDIGSEERPAAAEEITPSEALTSPIAKGVPWLAYQTGRTAPAMAGAALGGPAGAAGVLIGGGLGQFLTVFGPSYRDRIQRGEPEDDALKDALQSAGVSGAATGASFGAFGLPGSFLKQLLIQPSIAGAEKTLQNYLEGEPVTEGLGETLLGSELGMAIPRAGHRLAIRGRVTGLRCRVRQGQTAGSEAAAGTSQEPRPTTDMPTGDAQNRTTIGETGVREQGGEDLNTTGDRYAKPTHDRQAAVVGAPEYLGAPEVAPTPRDRGGPQDYGKHRTAAAERRDDVLRGPLPGEAARQAALGAKVDHGSLRHLPLEPVGLVDHDNPRRPGGRCRSVNLHPHSRPCCRPLRHDY
jgi:hypothetical protein